MHGYYHAIMVHDAHCVSHMHFKIPNLDICVAKELFVITSPPFDFLRYADMVIACIQSTGCHMMCTNVEGILFAGSNDINNVMLSSSS